MTNKLPKSLQGILWSQNIANLDSERDKNYVIHQVLAYGNWKHLLWLIKTYSLTQIKEAFVSHPAKDYSERSFNFVQKIILKIPNSVVDKRYYVKTYPRIIK
jgi:hypothetical protein